MSHIMIIIGGQMRPSPGPAPALIENTVLQFLPLRLFSTQEVNLHFIL